MKCPRCDHTVADGDRFCGRCGLAQPKDGVPVDPLVGVVVDGRYRIEKRIGVGGMGTVYVGHHVGLGQAVAIKVLHERHANNRQLVERFQLEARTYAKVDHPNVVKLLHFDQMADGTTYMVMEFCPGTSLAALLRIEGHLPPPLAVDLVIQVAQGLSATHGAGIVHRDLKPENIVLTETRRGRYHVKLLDFGIAKDLADDGPRLTQAGMVFGTPEYMAPEQARGQPVDERSDLYAIGCVLFELLTGKPPFTGTDKIQVMHRQATEMPASPRALMPQVAISAALEQVCLRCLEKRKEDRYDNVDTLIDALEAARPQGPVVKARPLPSAAPQTSTPAPSTTNAQPLAGPTPTPGTGLRRGTTPAPAVIPSIRRSSPGPVDAEEHFFIDPGPPPGFDGGNDGSGPAFFVAAVLFIGAIAVGAWFFSAKNRTPKQPPPRQTASAAVSTTPPSNAPPLTAPDTQAPATAAPATRPPRRPASKRPVRRTPASKAPASKAPASKAPASKAPASKAPASKAPASKPPSRPRTATPATKPPKRGPSIKAQLADAEKTLAAGRLGVADRMVEKALKAEPRHPEARALAARIAEVRAAWRKGKRAYDSADCRTALASLEFAQREAPGLPELDTMITACKQALPPREMP